MAMGSVKAQTASIGEDGSIYILYETGYVQSMTVAGYDTVEGSVSVT
jgi:hypothetical protein